VQVWSGPMKAKKPAVLMRAVLLLDACGEAQNRSGSDWPTSLFASTSISSPIHR
jgi:hypothetical protein